MSGLKHAEPVAVTELGEERLAVAVAAHGLDEGRQAGGVADGARHRRAVEVRAEADAVLADLGDQMVEVRDHVLERGVGVAAAVRAQEARREVDADEAAALADRGELAVGEIARMRRQRMGVRMRRDERRVGELRHVPEAGLVEVRQVDQDAARVAVGDERAPGIGQPRPGVGRRREAERNAAGKGVRPAPDEPERTQAGLVEDVEEVEIGVDRVRALDVQHAREHAAADRALDLGGAAADLHGARRGALDAEQERRHVDRHPLREGELEVLRERHVVGRGRHQLLDLRAAAARVVGGREDREEPAGKAAAAGLRQVDMARRPRRRGRRARPRRRAGTAAGERRYGRRRRRSGCRSWEPRFCRGRAPLGRGARIAKPAADAGQDRFRRSHV